MNIYWFAWKSKKLLILKCINLREEREKDKLHFLQTIIRFFMYYYRFLFLWNIRYIDINLKNQ